MSKPSLPTLTPLALLTSATAAAASTFPSHVTQPGRQLVDHSTAPVTEEDGATEGAEILRILLTTVASTRSGSFHLASSAAVTNAGVACASVSEDTQTMD